jgi:hypothetical protein
MTDASACASACGDRLNDMAVLSPSGVRATACRHIVTCRRWRDRCSLIFSSAIAAMSGNQRQEAAMSAARQRTRFAAARAYASLEGFLNARRASGFS